jgi:REP element-mobilizing transposase RayT
VRKNIFVEGEYYHIYNRGVDKRDIFLDKDDLERFFQSMNEFNSEDPIGSIYEKVFRNKKLKFGGSTSKNLKLVDFVCFCLNPNHYHFILTPLVEKGIEKFMQRLGTGYTMYFNNKNKRTGALFAGRFKSIHISNNEYLLHLSAYVNLNYKVHTFGGSTSKLSMSSWEEYLGVKKESFCHKEIILDQFKDIKFYKNFAEDSIRETAKRRMEDKELEKILLE